MEKGRKEKIIEIIDNELVDFRKEVKRLEDINSPIQILDTSKNFVIQKKGKIADQIIKLIRSELSKERERLEPEWDSCGWAENVGKFNS